MESQVHETWGALVNKAIVGRDAATGGQWWQCPPDKIALLGKFTINPWETVIYLRSHISHTQNFVLSDYLWVRTTDYNKLNWSLAFWHWNILCCSFSIWSIFKYFYHLLFGAILLYLSLLLKLDLCVCVFVCPVCIKVLGE